MPKEKEEQVFYVGIKDPLEIRRSMLESSKELLQYLQRFEKFKAVRKEKAEQTAKLKGVMKEITTLVKQLKSNLPKTGLRAAKHKEKPKPKKVTVAAPKKEAPKVEVEKPKEMTELEKLESELSEIEGRLTGLS
ncbi:hypothetical protein KY332_04405 [Candidatus Woesearchaeota archaeon]|nr:hypothetical protein [Candidatus Woesearchaeota archaeon]